MKNQVLIIGITLVFQIKCFSQVTIIDSLIKTNSYTIEYSEKQLSGTGADFLINATKKCQFVSLGEEHNALDIPIFTTKLFTLLQQNHGFNYLALEQDPLRCQILSAQQNQGKRDSAFTFVKRFPYSYTFASNQEINMMADISGLSKGKGRPVWGCDQSFGTMHVLTELLNFSPSKKTTAFLKIYMDSVWTIENNRDNDGHFLSEKCTAADIQHLKMLFQAVKNPRAFWLINCLEVSQRIYENNSRSGKGVIGASYLSNDEREEYMKERFMEEYIYALEQDHKIPKVILKFGHWHLQNGFSPANVLSTGNFVRALAKTNNLQSFCINMQIYGKPGSNYGALVKSELYSLFTHNADIDKWTIIDLRPFRLYMNKIKKDRVIMDEKLFQRFSDMTFGFDALLLFGSGSQATYDWKKE